MNLTVRVKSVKHMEVGRLKTGEPTIRAARDGRDIAIVFNDLEAMKLVRDRISIMINEDEKAKIEAEVRKGI